MRMNADNLESNITNPDIIRRLSEKTNQEIWNCTYSKAIEMLASLGLYTVVEPFFTMSTKDNVAWSVSVVRVPYGDGRRITKWMDECSYKSRIDAVGAAISKSLDMIPSKTSDMGSRMYGRHCEEDPFPFE